MLCATRSDRQDQCRWPQGRRQSRGLDGCRVDPAPDRLLLHSKCRKQAWASKAASGRVLTAKWLGAGTSWGPTFCMSVVVVFFCMYNSSVKLV